MVTIDVENATLDVPDLGVTLRTLMACGAKGYEKNPKRVWKVRYGTVIIGSVRLRTRTLKTEGLSPDTAEGVIIEKEVQSESKL